MQATRSRRDRWGAFQKTALAAVLSVSAAAIMVACQPAIGVAAASAPAAAAPLPVVSVATVQQRAVQPMVSHVGRVEAARRVEIRPRVAGHIDAVLFREGELVRAGQPLVRIDTRPFDAVLARAQADLSLARAQEQRARSEAERARKLAAEQAIAVEEAERRQGQWAEAQARSAAAQAAVQAAALEREFAVITAPIDGRMGRALVTAGNYVGAGASQAPLATLVAVAPLHVHFDVSDPALVGQLAGTRQGGQGGKWQAHVVDSQQGQALAHAPVDFVDNEIAASAGTLRLRARIDKPVPGLLPGQMVRVQLAGEARDSLLAPEKAIGMDQGQRYVMVVRPDQQLEYRVVKTGAAHGDQRVITAGLKAGEQVVVSGLMKVRPGMKVQPQPADAAVAAVITPTTPKVTP